VKTAYAYVIDLRERVENCGLSTNELAKVQTRNQGITTDEDRTQCSVVVAYRAQQIMLILAKYSEFLE